MGILDDIDAAAYDLERGLLGELTPISRNFTIVRDAPLANCVSTYHVFSYETCVAYVSKRHDGSLLVLVKRDAFYHSTTTSRHLRCFLSALIGRIDWDALYKACNKACDDETINGHGNPWINVREVA